MPEPRRAYAFQVMADPNPAPMPKDASSFANLLASFTGAVQKTSATWDDSALLDDVSTITYEQALRSHRRVTPAATSPLHEAESTPANFSPKPATVATGKKRKSASITIRLTEAEQAQLKQRAAAADLSISVYLRSCIFEAELLRAQVKEALSQMKAATAPICDESGANPTSSWRTRLLPHWSRHRT
jgi:hypothetical protein